MNTIDALRQQIDTKYQEAIKALDTIKSYLLDVTPSPDLPAPAAPPTPSTPVPTAKETRPRAAGGKKTRVDIVLDAVSSDYKTVEQISVATKIAEAKVRAVLYSKSVKDKVQHKKIDKKLAFRLKAARTQHAHNGAVADVSTAALVRNVLAKHPEGLDTRHITQEVEKFGGGKPATTAALYNMKTRGTLLHEPDTGIYTLPPAAERDAAP